MRTSRRAPTRERRIPRRLLVVVACLALLAGVVVTSLAVYNATTGTSGSSLQAGTIDVATAPTTLELDAGALVPGDVVATPLTVRNDGSLELRYSFTSTVDTAALADLVVFEIRVGVTDCDPVGAAADGTLVAGPQRLGSVTGEPVLGDPTRGADPGDRTLAAGGSEVLCLRVELPATVEEAEGAGLVVSADLRVDAEQTAANP